MLYIGMVNGIWGKPMNANLYDGRVQNGEMKSLKSDDADNHVQQG